MTLQHFHFWCLQCDRTQRGFSSRTGVPGKLACWGGRKAALLARSEKHSCFPFRWSCRPEDNFRIGDNLPGTLRGKKDTR